MITFGLAVICTIDVYLFLFLIGIFIPLFAVYSLWEIRKLIPHSRELNSKRNVFS